MSPFSTADAETFAAALLAARQPGAPRAALPPAVPPTEAAAYQVQDLVRARLGPTEGWKVGAAKPGSPPNCSPVLKGGVITASQHGGPLSIPVPRPTGIEVEIAFRLNRAFPAADVAPSTADVVAAIGSAHIAMELCACRLAAGPKAPPLASLADNGMNLGFLIGAEIKGWRDIDMATQAARAIVDDIAVVSTSGGHTHKDLVALLVWLVGHVVTQRGGLADGAVVATGSWTGVHWLERPATVGAEFPGHGRLEARLAM